MFRSTAACQELRSLRSKRYETTGSKRYGKSKSIAEHRSSVEANLQQSEDHRCPRSNALCPYVVSLGKISGKLASVGMALSVFAFFNGRL